MDSRNAALDEKNAGARENAAVLDFSSNAASFLITASGLALIAWSFSSELFRDEESAYKSLICLPISAGAALAAFGLSVKTLWRKTGFWFAIALVGQAAALQLINAGPALRYQHYKSANEIFHDSSPVIWGFLFIQIALVAAGIIFRGAEIFAWLKKNLKFWQALVISAFFFIPTATVSENVRFYAEEWLFAGFIQTINLGNIILFALSIPKEYLAKLNGFFARIFSRSGENDSAQTLFSKHFILILAALVAALSAFLNFYSYERHPHVPDEVVYLIHAQFFASGALTMPAPPVPEAFEVYLMQLNGGIWYPSPPPGWALVLAVGALFGAAWLVNPFLAGLNLILAYKILQRIYSERTARVSAFLLAVSPWYVFLGMSFMTHMFALTCALIAALGVVQARRTGKFVWALGGGLALGMLVSVRPLEALAMTGLIGFWALGVGGKRLKYSSFAALVFGSMITGGLGLFYNFLLTGNFLKFPINVYTDEHFGANSNAYGFGPDRGMGWALDPNPGHSPLDALINTNLNVSTLNTELFGWSAGSFLLIAAFFCFGKMRRADYLMLAVIAVIYVLHFFYYFSGGPDFSARYWFLIVVPLVALTARGILISGAKFKRESAGADARFYTAIAALCLMTLINFIPWRSVDKYHNFRGMRPDIRHLASRFDFGTSLILIRGNKHPEYDSAMIYNPLDFQAKAPIYAWDRDAETRRRLLEFYADRPVWIINSPSITGRGFEVAAGPLSAAELLKETAK
jgi:hypothetical protein